MEATRQRKKVRSISSSAALKGNTCLVVEDNKVNQLVAVRMLKALGVVCDVADDGVEAVEACKKRLYDIVLMVRRHPSIPGWGCCSHPVDVGWYRKNKESSIRSGYAVLKRSTWVCVLPPDSLTLGTYGVTLGFRKVLSSPDVG